MITGTEYLPCHHQVSRYYRSRYHARPIVTGGTGPFVHPPDICFLTQRDMSPPFRFRRGPYLLFIPGIHSSFPSRLSFFHPLVHSFPPRLSFFHPLFRSFPSRLSFFHPLFRSFPPHHLGPDIPPLPPPCPHSFTVFPDTHLQPHPRPDLHPHHHCLIRLPPDRHSPFHHHSHRHSLSRCRSVLFPAGTILLIPPEGHRVPQER